MNIHGLIGVEPILFIKTDSLISIIDTGIPFNPAEITIKEANPVSELLNGKAGTRLFPLGVSASKIA